MTSQSRHPQPSVPEAPRQSWLGLLATGCRAWTWSLGSADIDQPSLPLWSGSYLLPGPFVPTGCSITEAVTILGNKLRDYQGQFNTTHLLALCNYFHNTFIRHYKLYQYVLGQDRDVNLTVADLEVCTPPQPLPLTEGKDWEVWKHEQQLEELRMAEVQKRINMLLLKGALHLKQQHLLQETFSELPGRQHQALKREELEKLISEAIHIQIEGLKELLQYEIQITFDILDLKLQKKTLNLNAPIPALVPIASQSGQDEALRLSKTNKRKKAKAKK
ncbi:hypothetical protein FD755_019832 [Muntiacus reevesi]|uniref:Uncharacterized protein n=1 Tax=Muntiacus reevesi TaxID=9886 RepID=A0A5N3X6M4_MUNRE|nr:hypothetical protein FD755_019832 [Muntiacus reevesi]